MTSGHQLHSSVCFEHHIGACVVVQIVVCALDADDPKWTELDRVQCIVCVQKPYCVLCGRAILLRIASKTKGTATSRNISLPKISISCVWLRKRRVEKSRYGACALMCSNDNCLAATGGNGLSLKSETPRTPLGTAIWWQQNTGGGGLTQPAVPVVLAIL